MINHWVGLGGTVERGYAGKGLWAWDDLPKKIEPRYTDYARAEASIGINAVILNNVNADPRILGHDYLEKVAALADIFRKYHIKVYLAPNFAAPVKPSTTKDVGKQWGGVGIGHLDTADPLNPEVQKWWMDKVNEIYSLIPDFGGFLVKANSEGMAGPQDYHRSHVDGANMLARALKPHGGIVLWRTFVYNPEIDKDRMKRSYKEFQPLDGQFDENVVLQTKTERLTFSLANRLNRCSEPCAILLCSLNSRLRKSTWGVLLAWCICCPCGGKLSSISIHIVTEREVLCRILSPERHSRRVCLAWQE